MSTLTAYLTPQHIPKYAKAKVLHTQDKHPSAEQLLRARLLLLLLIKSFAATSLLEYVDTHSQPTGYLKNWTFP